jgi:hypothetical protein
MFIGWRHKMAHRRYKSISWVEFFLIFAFKYFFSVFRGFTILSFSGPDNFRVAREHSEKKSLKGFQSGKICRFPELRISQK